MSTWLVLALILLGIGLMVLASRIRQGGPGARPSIARGVRGRYGAGGDRSLAEIERERIERERTTRTDGPD